MKKIIVLSSLGGLLLLSLLLPRTQEAAEVSPEKFVENYIELGMASDYESIVDLISDDRFANEDRQTRVDIYKELQEDLPALEAYEIKEVKNVTAEKTTVLAVLDYEDGSIEQAPMHLVQEKGNWKLQLGSEDVKVDEDFEQIQVPDSDNTF